MDHILYIFLSIAIDVHYLIYLCINAGEAARAILTSKKILEFYQFEEFVIIYKDDDIPRNHVKVSS